MLPTPEEAVKAYQQDRLAQAAATQLLKQCSLPKTTFQDRILLGAGDGLISLGLRLKGMSQPAGDSGPAPLFAEYS